jgi:hypothetical protein
MTATKYTYSIATDFVINHRVDGAALIYEISCSTIVIAPDRVDTDGDVCDIWMKAELPEGEITKLNAVVAAHQGNSIAPGPSPVTLSSPAEEDSSPIVSTTNLTDCSENWAPSPRNFFLGGKARLVSDLSGGLVGRTNVLTDAASFRDDFPGTDVRSAITGTVTFTNGSTTVTGVGTAFLTELNLHHYVRLNGHTNWKLTQVSNILSDTELKLSEPYSGATGTDILVKSYWRMEEKNGGTVACSTSDAVLAIGTDSGSHADIQRYGDYLPYYLGIKAALSQRIANQWCCLGLSNNEPFEDDTVCAMVIMEGTDATKLKLRTRSSAATEDAEETTVSIPGGLTTDNEIYYRLEVQAEKVTLFVNQRPLAEHFTHIPGPYDPMNLYCGLRNTAAAASITSLHLDFVHLSNFDRVETALSVKGDPISTRVQEDIHTLTGSLTTSLVNADQVILQYTVPAGKTFWIVGYSLNNGETTIRGNPVKIGRNTMTDEVDAPGSVDGNIFRAFNKYGGSTGDNTAGELFGASPRWMANAGDVVKMTVTPTGSSTTKWRASIDFILR